MVRFYAICLDAFPETDSLKSKLKDCQRIDYVCAGAFTTATMTTMISGTVGSKIIPGGIGYNTSYLPRSLEWRKNKSALTDVVMRSGQQLIMHNHIPWFSANLVGTALTPQQRTQHYRDHQVEVKDSIELKDISSESIIPDGLSKVKSVILSRKDNLIYSCSHPDLTLNTFVEWGTPERKEQFYSNEKEYFSFIKDRFHGLLWTDLCHWHEAVYYPQGNPYHDCSKNSPINRDDALNDSINWLDSFDFNQPDSVFFIYADHGYRVQPYLETPGFITWAYWKDNRVKPQSLRPVISSYDVYPLILSVLTIPNLSSEISESPFLPYDPDRVYYTEDGRGNAKITDRATVFTRTQLINNKVWISVSHVIEEAAIDPGYYVIIASREDKENYDVYHIESQKQFHVTCSSPISNRECQVLNNISLPEIYKEIVIYLGVPREALFSRM